MHNQLHSLDYRFTFAVPIFSLTNGPSSFVQLFSANLLLSSWMTNMLCNFCHNVEADCLRVF